MKRRYAFAMPCMHVARQHPASSPAEQGATCIRCRNSASFRSRPKRGIKLALGIPPHCQHTAVELECYGDRQDVDSARSRVSTSSVIGRTIAKASPVIRRAAVGGARRSSMVRCTTQCGTAM